MEHELSEVQRLYRQKELWLEIRHHHQTEEMKAQLHIEKLSDQIKALESPTGSAYDVSPLHQSMRERLLEGLDHILDRISP